jgi:hypothetical protein
LAFSIASAFSAWNASDLNKIFNNGDASVYSTGQTGNTDLCRLYHLTVATELPSHCTHGDFGSKNDNTASLAAACAATGEDFLDNLCKIVQTGCGTTAFNNSAACRTGLTALLAKPGMPPMNASLPDDDTLACRLANAGAALAAKKVGASTDGFCNKIKGIGGCKAAVTPTAAKNSATAAAASGVVALLALML